MGNLWLFVVTPFLLAGSLRGQETNFTSGCLLDNMYSLSCSEVGITTLQEVGQENKQLPSWPRSPKILKIIKHINLSNNMISSLHLNIFYKFLSLETLNISNNYITMVSMNYGQEGKGAILPSLHTLVIDRNRLSFVPKGLGKLASLQTLQLSANSIVRIQRDDFANCTQLQNLDLGDNRIHKIDLDVFRDLRNLKVLRLSNNALVSITPLVFLYSHVLRADIDLSYNRWACDCRILPLKHLLTSLPVDIKKEWNVTCSTPPSRTGSPLLSVDHFNGSCKSPAEKYIYARRIEVKKNENTYLPCNVTDKAGGKKAFWWTPQGIISGEPSAKIDRMNNFILTELDRTHEGLYICIADMERIVYQVHFRTYAGQTLIRRPRDVRALNTRMQTEADFSRAVVLSVVISFIFAFLLGVFVRPCLERLFRKLCKSEDSKTKTSTEVYNNEGFSEENESSNGFGGSLPVQVSDHHSLGNDADYVDPDNHLKYVNITYNEREIHYKDQQCNVDIQVPTCSEPQERRSDIYELVEDRYKDLHATENSRLTNSKRVTWAFDEESSPKVNLKHLIYLLKPINIIVPETQIEYTHNHHQRKPRRSDSHTIIPKKNRGSSSDSSSSDESEFWDAEYFIPDADNIVNYVSTQPVGSTSNSHVIPTINLRQVMSLLKPINFIVSEFIQPVMAKTQYNDLSDGSSQFKDINQDYSLSDHGSSSSAEDYSSEDDSIINTNTTKDNESCKVNLKHAMSKLKPINIIIPEYIASDIVKSPTQKQMFPIVLPTKDAIGSETFYDSSSSDYEAKDYSDSYIGPNTNKDIKQTLYDSSSSEDGSAEETRVIESVLLTTKREPWRTKENDNPTVDLKYVMRLVKPINILSPEPIMSDLVKSPTLTPFYPSSVPRYQGHRMEEKDILHYQDKQFGGTENKSHNKEMIYHSSSSDDGSIDYDDSSDDEVTLNSGLLPIKQASWKTNMDTNQTVNLQQVITLLKPINIVAPKSPVSELDLSQEKIYPSGISRLPEDRMEAKGNPQNYYQDIKQPSIRPTYHPESKKTFSDSSSSEDEDQSSDEEAIVPSILLTKEATWPRKENSAPTVNLKHVMSLVKPINITIPESMDTNLVKRPSQVQIFPTNVPRYPEHKMENIGNLHYYPHIQPEPQNEPYNRTPNLLIDDKEENVFYGSSSSDEGSEFDYDDSSDETVKMNPDFSLAKQTSWISNSDPNPTVNFQQVISLLKPINIIAPTFVSRLEESHSLLKESENQSPKYDNGFVSSTRPTHFMEDKQTSSDSSSSDNESKEDHRADDGSMSPSLLLTKLESWARKQNISPTVNLKHVMSLVKPINIEIPESTEIDLVKSPSQTQFIPDNISKYPEHRGENVENLHYYQDREPEYKPWNKNQSDDKSPTLPVRDGDGKTFYDSSSSDGSKEDSSDEEVKMNSALLLTNQLSWKSKENESPRVNLQQVISLLKPINIRAPNYSVTEPVRSPSQKESFPTGNTSYEARDFIPSAMLTNDSKGKQTFDDSSSSEDESRDKDQSSDEESMKNYETRTSNGNLSPTVNFRHVMSLVKPISIIVPEFTASDKYQSPSQNQFFTSVIPRKPEEKFEDIQLSRQPEYPSHSTSNETYETPSSPTGHKESMQRSYDSSSEDESKKHHRSDKGGKMYSDLPTTKPASKEVVRPSVNLKQIMLLIKPIKIVSPESITDLRMYYPHNHIYNKQYGKGETQSQDPNYGKHYLELLNRPIKHEREIVYDSSSSDDDSDKEEDNCSDEGGRMISDLLLTENSTWASTENVSPKVDHKYATSLVDPINIKAPESSVTEALIRFKEKYNSQLHEHQAINQLQNTTFKDLSVDTLICHNTIRDDESKHFLHELDQDSAASIVMGEYDGDSNPKVNLNHAMSLLKPLNIIVPDSTSIVAVKGPDQKYTFNMYQPGDRMENTDTYHHHHDQDNRFHSGNSRKLLTNKSLDSCNSELANTFYIRSLEEESSQNLYKSDIKTSAHLTPEQATLTNNDNTSPNVNLNNVLSLIKPINIAVPDSTSTDTVMIPAKVLLADRWSHTLSDYYTVSDSLSDDGSFFSFSGSRYNSLTDDPENRDITRHKVGRLMDAQWSNRKKEMDRDKVSKSGKINTDYPNPNTTQQGEGLKDFAGGGHEPNKSEDILHWLSNANDEPNNELSTSKTLFTQTPGQELVFDLNTHDWTTRTAVRKEILTMPTDEPQTFGNKTYFISEFGETSTDANVPNINSKDSLDQIDVKMQRVVSPTVDHSKPEPYESFLTSRRRVFEAFSESLKEEEI